MAELGVAVKRKEGEAEVSGDAGGRGTRLRDRRLTAA